MNARRAGFTLWEISIVLGVIAVISTLVVPNWTRLGTEQPPESGELLTRVLRDTRRVAIERQVTAVLRLDPATGAFRVDTTGVNGTGVFTEDLIEVGTWESIITDLPRLTFVFRATGAAFGDTVVVRGADATVMVALNAWSGQPLVYAR